MSLREQIRGQVNAACALLAVVLVGVLYANTEKLAAQSPGKQVEKPPGTPVEKEAQKNPRATPGILYPTEGRVDIAHAQIKCYDFDASGEKVMVLRQKLQGRPPGGADFAHEWIPIDNIGDLKQTDSLADKVVPVRMAIIAASFPYKKQVQEFKDQLRLDSTNAVLDETVRDEKDPTTSKHTFNFVPPRVERRLVDAHGNPMGEWAPLDLEKNYLRLVYDNGQRFAAEPDKLLAVSFENLVMPKLAVFGNNQYPNVEARLDDLQKMLNMAKPKPEQNVLDPFKKKPTLPPAKDIDPKSEDAIPEYCLIRVIDVTVRPGKFYHYRIKVRMANPNFGMKNVAVPTDAMRKEPLESAWFEIHPKNDDSPQVVAMPSEYHLYAVDQQEIDVQKGDKYTGQNANVSKYNRAVFQIHKWLQETNTKPTLPVGEWSVAERVLVHRGEYIGVRERVEVPYWNSMYDKFVLAKDNTPRGAIPPKGIEVDFGPPIIGGKGQEKPYPILVDFEGGTVSYNRVIHKDDKSASIKVTDTAEVETLILSADGKLLSHASWNDKVDHERIKRLNNWRQRIKEVRDGK